ncbi:GntR family transcriptional regulator [Micromonospora chalcea]|uniref:GntR family transcriptional regulator n=1 Tax=Micromonospora chalcea TaxID=1874 RepID=UPI0021A48CD5|nr:GntR family transcriptional regulator [Micromonospora chalcea]MCT2279115.1 GntR family transcriptional regulator [Micromonospora chalcea]
MPTPHYGQPRYRSIADELRKRIQNGSIPPGSLLPAESTLTAEFQASRGTVRQSIAVLREAGLVATEHGRGTYACLRPANGGSEESSKTETRQRQVTADAALAALFSVREGAALIEEESVVRRDGVTESVARTYRLLRKEECIGNRDR